MENPIARMTNRPPKLGGQ